MAGKTTKVNVALDVDVTGTKDIDQLARAMEDAAKQAGKPLEVDAKVTGAADVGELGDALDSLPDGRVDAKVSASVTGADKVDTLAADIAGLPAATRPTVTASVTGDDKVDTLAADIAGLPAATRSTVTASVAGDDIGALADDIHALPAQTDVSVSVSASSPAGKSLKDVGKDIDDVKTKSGDLAVEGSAFGSQFLGSYSEGAGLFGDLAEQLSNLKRSADEAGGLTGSGGLKGILSIAGGLGAGILGGLLIDQVLGAFTQLTESQAAVKEAIDSTSQAIIDQGGFWSQTASLASITAIEGNDAFKGLIAAGEDYGTVMEAFSSGGDTVAKVNELMLKHGASLGIMAANEVEGLGNIASASKDAAKDKYAYLKANDLLTDSQKEAEASARGAADGADLTGDAARHAADDVDYLTGRANVFNKTPLKDKKATIDTDDKASPKVDKANKKDLTDKEATLTATDQASPKVDGVNRKDMPDKKNYLSATDLATPKVDSYNTKPMANKSALLDADPTPAQAQIDGLDGQTVNLLVHFDISQLEEDRLRRVGVDTSSIPGGSSASSAPHVGLRATSVPVAVPIQVTVNGALDPAAVARQIRQILVRGERRTGMIRAGGTDPLRAPV